MSDYLCCIQLVKKISKKFKRKRLLEITATTKTKQKFFKHKEPGKRFGQF